MKLQKLKINNKSLGGLNGINIHITTELYEVLKKEKTRDGSNLLKLFQGGRALRGFKHLLETIREKDKNAKIVFTSKDTKKENGDYYISYSNYGKSTGNRFFALYRETGLDGARFFLNKHFPADFEYDKSRITNSQLKKIDKNFPTLIKDLSEKAKNKRALLKQTTDVIKELKSKKTLLKEEIQQLDRLRSESNIYYFQRRTEELSKRVGKKYSETKGKNSWQNWIYSNNWLFGTHYQVPIQKEKIGFDNIPDYLFPSIDGFIDILEIKLPNADVIIKDESHPGSYRWSSKTSEAIGQVVNYLHEIELNQLQIKQRINRKYSQIFDSELYIIKPRAFIVIGNKIEWGDEKIEALRILNHSLHGIEVLTYTDLIYRGKQIIEMYNKKLSG